MTSVKHHKPKRKNGTLPLKDYAALGDGRSVALSGTDGSIDWWCVPNMHAAPLFGRLIDAPGGGHFCITPTTPYHIERRYRPGSNVLETVFTTATGSARLTESINSGMAGRLPWCELARRIEGLKGHVTFKVMLRFKKKKVPIWQASPTHKLVFHIDDVLGTVVISTGIKTKQYADGLDASFSVRKGERKVMALVAGDDEPLFIPTVDTIDKRLDLTDKEWRDWSKNVVFKGKHRSLLVRNALALKLLLYSPTGAIAAAPTTSLPEWIGADRNYDYRFAWVRDTSYILKAFLNIGAHTEAKAAFGWLINRVAEHGVQVLYTLDGDKAPSARNITAKGYQKSTPVRVGNAAATQHQHGVYGDIFELAYSFVEAGGILGPQASKLLVGVAENVLKNWQKPDSGIWELPEKRHYTISKIGCWQALMRATALAEQGHLPKCFAKAWGKQRDAIAHWIDTHCWSEKKQAYTLCPDNDVLDASVVLAARWGFKNKRRLLSTITAVDRELGCKGLHYRLSNSRSKEGCFLACTLWMIGAKVDLGHRAEAERDFKKFMKAVKGGTSILPEMIDPQTGDYLGNMPLGLTHLAMVQILIALYGQKQK